MEDKYIFASLIVIWIVGLALLFVVQKRLQETKPFFKRLPPVVPDIPVSPARDLDRLPMPPTRASQ